MKSQDNGVALFKCPDLIGVPITKMPLGLEHALDFLGGRSEPSSKLKYGRNKIQQKLSGDAGQGVDNRSL